MAYEQENNDLKNNGPVQEKEPVWRVIFDPDRDAPTLGKGQSAENLPPNVLALDTGTPLPPPENLRDPENQTQVDAVYRETIGRGIIDHHSIDHTVNIPSEQRRCTTAMLAGFPTEVLAMMTERGIDRVTSHHDSDLDSTCSTYLAKSLLQYGRLPQIASRLSEFVNKVDYGRFRENDPDKFLHSLQGAFSAIKHTHTNQRDFEMKKIWTDENATTQEKIKLSDLCRDKYQGLILRDMFDLLNSAEEQLEKGAEVDFEDFAFEDLPVNQETRDALVSGGSEVKEDFVRFERVFEKAETTTIQVQGKDGKSHEVQLFIVDSSSEPDISPLGVASIAYQRVPAESIIAVWAGSGRRKGGDIYDIGMKPESTEIFTLKFLEAALNDAEEEKRQPILADLERKNADGTITEEEKKTLTAWRTPREGFEYLGHGDPTVCVAGGSLVAASNTSLLGFGDFRLALLKAKSLAEKPRS